jgi:hypothetical protein
MIDALACRRSASASCTAALIVVPALTVALSAAASAAEGKRTGWCEIKSSSFQGNWIGKVAGAGEIKDENGNTIAKGDLKAVEGWIAVKGLKGVKFRWQPQSDTDTKPDKGWQGQPSAELAVVSLGPDQQWELLDDHFLFLIDSSYGLQFDFAASFARATELRVGQAAELSLWGNRVSVGKGGGTVRIVRGSVVGGQNIKSKNIKTSEPPLQGMSPVATWVSAGTVAAAVAGLILIATRKRRTRQRET